MRGGDPQRTEIAFLQDLIALDWPLVFTTSKGTSEGNSHKWSLLSKTLDHISRRKRSAWRLM